MRVLTDWDLGELCRRWDMSGAIDPKDLARAVESAVLAKAVPQVREPTDAELIEFAVEEQFLLFCSQDEFVDIARGVLVKFGAAAPEKICQQK